MVDEKHREDDDADDVDEMAGFLEKRRGSLCRRGRASLCVERAAAREREEAAAAMMGLIAACACRNVYFLGGRLLIARIMIDEINE